MDSAGKIKKPYKKVYIEITNVCNKNCSFCVKTTRPPAFMTREQFERAAEAVRPYTDHVYFHLMGEPLLHPDLEQFLRICEEKKLQVNITTNGTLLESKAPILLSSPALRKISVSLHSFEDENKEEADYFKQCIAFAKAASAAGKIVELRLWNLDSQAEKENIFFLSMAGKAFDLALTPADLQASSQYGIKLADRIYLGTARRFVWPSLERQEVWDSLFCYGLRDQFGILADGRVVPCCLDHEGDVTLGNIFDLPLGDILNSPRARAIFDGFSNRKAVEELCKRCGYALKFNI